MAIAEEVLREISYKPKPLDKNRPRIFLVMPPSPQIPTPGREFLLRAPVDGLTYIGSTLKNAGYEVEVVDLRIDSIISIESSIDEILKYERVVVGLYTTCDSYNFLEDFTARIKQNNKDIPIILGGPFVSSIPEVLMKCLSVDYAVAGEGELTILELMDALSSKKKDSISNIAGVYYKEDGRVIFTKSRTQIKDLDSLPHLDLGLWPSVKKDSVEKIGISSSRGCFANCSFCFKSISEVNAQSPQRFTEEVNLLMSRYGLRYCYLNDLNFVINKERTHRLCEGLKKTGLRWACSTRVDNIDEDLLRAMREAGCEEIWYGFESVDQRVLDVNFKGISVEDIKNAIKLNNKVGIKVMGNFIIGLLGETEDSLEKMVRFIEDEKEVIPCSVKYLTPFPGTYVYRYARQKGLIKDDIEYFKMLSRRKVNYAEDEIINCTALPEERLREAFRKIRKISYERYGPLDWSC